MDFSFVTSDAGLQRKQPPKGQPPGQPPTGGGTSAAAATTQPAAAGPRPGTIAIPSFREVQVAERQRAQPTPMFRSSGSGAAAAAAGPGTQPRQDVNPFAFIDGGPSPPLAQRPRQQQRPQQTQKQANRPAYPSSNSTPPPQQQQQCGGSVGLQSAPPYQHQQQQQQHRPPGQPRYMSPQAALPGPQPPQHQPPSYQQQRPQHQPQAMMQPPPPMPQQNFPANAIIVSKRQEGNPVLRHIRNVRWQFGDIVPDYLVGRDAACLFLSLRYHLLKPEYIHHRIRELQRSFRLRIILCHVDTEDAVEPLAQVTRAALGNDCTLICGWSSQECARYLETFKSYEHKPAEVIQKDLGNDYQSRINAALTSVRGVNKTDVKTLGDRFGSVAAIFEASAEELQACPGIGPTKARRLHETFHQPFRRSVTAVTAAAAGAGAAGVQRLQQQQQQQQQQRQQQAPPKGVAGPGGGDAAAAEEGKEMEEAEEWPQEELSEGELEPGPSGIAYDEEEEEEEEDFL